jgi:hypothetical protein
MQESLHCAIAFVLAGLAYRGIHGGPPAADRRSPDAPAPRNRGVGFLPFLVAVALASVIRVTWALVLIPWAVVVLSHRSERLPSPSLRKRIGMAAVAAAAIPGLALAWRTICAPYANTTTSILFFARTSPGLAFWDVLLRLQRGLDVFLLRSTPDGFSVLASPLPKAVEYLRAFQHAEVSALVAGGLAVAAFRRSRAVLFAALNLLVLAVVVTALYDLRNDYRLLAPHLLLSLLVLLSAPSAGGRRVVLAVAGLQALFLPAFLSEFSRYHADRVRFDRAEIARFAEGFDAVRYDPGADGWENTVLVPLDSVGTPLLGLPPGVGSTYVFRWGRVPQPLKSRWLLLPHGSDLPNNLSAVQRSRLRLIRSTPRGDLYRNASDDEALSN